MLEDICSHDADKPMHTPAQPGPTKLTIPSEAELLREIPSLFAECYDRHLASSHCSSCSHHVLDQTLSLFGKARHQAGL